MHHTGIKTQDSQGIGIVTLHFNCTIQELKQFWYYDKKQMFFVFQLHHTGIKTEELVAELTHNEIFQLHHTGIKTTSFRFLLYHRISFQLHHTGIKTKLYDCVCI